MSENYFNDELADLFVDLEDDPEFKEASESLDPGYQIAHHRLSKGLTQAQLADLVGTSQSSIARLENGSSPPSLSFLRRVAKAMGLKANVELIDIDNVKEEQKQNQSETLEVISSMQDSAIHFINVGDFFRANKIYDAILDFISKCHPTSELEKISFLIQREVHLVSLLSAKSNQHSTTMANLEISLSSLLTQIREPEARYQPLEDQTLALPENFKTKKYENVELQSSTPEDNFRNF